MVSPRHVEVTSEKKLVLQLLPTPVLGADISAVSTRSRADRDVSVSFESITAEEMERSGALDLSDALRSVSSVVIDQLEGVSASAGVTQMKFQFFLMASGLMMLIPVLPT